MPSDDDNDDVDDGIASKRRRTVRPSILMKLNSLTESNGLTVTKDDQGRKVYNNLYMIVKTLVNNTLCKIKLA
jgi:hypothetical protein